MEEKAKVTPTPYPTGSGHARPSNPAGGSVTVTPEKQACYCRSTSSARLAQRETCEENCPDDGRGNERLQEPILPTISEVLPWRWHLPAGTQGWWGLEDETSKGDQNLLLRGNVWIQTPVVFKCCTWETAPRPLPPGLENPEF